MYIEIDDNLIEEIEDRIISDADQGEDEGLSEEELLAKHVAKLLRYALDMEEELPVKAPQPPVCGCGTCRCAAVESQDDPEKAKEVDHYVVGDAPSAPATITVGDTYTGTAGIEFAT